MSTEEQSAGTAASEPASNTQNAPVDAEKAPSPAGAEPAPSAAVGSADASAPEAGAESDDGAEDGGDEAGGHDAPEGSAEAGATTGDPTKRKRKRRRKKKRPEGATAEGVPGAEGAPAGEGAAEGAVATEGGRPGGGRDRQNQQNQQKKREPRERPPFALGDIVFGKVQDVTDDVLFVDLSSKAIGIFDLRELLIVDTTEATPTEDEAAVAAEGGEPVAATETTEAVPAAESAAVEGAAPEANQVEANQVEAAPVKSTEDAAAEAASIPAESPGPQLPVVILQPGAQFVGVVHNDGGRGGLVVLTHHPDRASRAKPMVSKAHKEGTLVYGIVTGVIKGGVEVDVDGLRAFAPASHMDLRMGSDLHPLLGQRLPFAVTEYGKRGRDVVLSRRQILESVSQQRREEALKHLTVGQEIEGTVRSVVPFGAFIDVGGVEGLVPLSEMSHNRADQPSDVFKVGETVKVKLLRIDEKNKLWLSRRALVEDPWAKVKGKYAPGTVHQGKVARIHPLGVFVELEPGVDGLIHRGDLSFKTIEDPSEIGVTTGADIEVVVAHADGGAHRIALHPTLKGEEAKEQPQKIAMNKGVRVKVVQPEAGGLQVRILGTTGWQARGYIPAMATGTPRGTELRKDFPIGKELEAKVVDLDSKKGEIKLSIRAFHQDNEREAYNAYRQQVKREAKFGTFADLLSKHVSKGDS